MTYEKLLKNIYRLQGDLMDIEDYSDDVYQAFETLIDELEEVIEND